LNVALFFARKMRGFKQYKNTVSARIINIATLAVALGVASILDCIGFKSRLTKRNSKKTSAFNGHILVTLFENNESQISIIPFQDSDTLRAQLYKEQI
jgi:lipoprotein-releasing system permease protein